MITKVYNKLNIKYPVPANTKIANMHAVTARVLMTNMRWFFEGVSLTNPDSEIEVWLPKSDKIRVNMLSLNPGLLEYLGWGSKAEEKEAAKEKLKEKLIGRLDEIIEAGTEFVCGDSILSLKDPTGYEISCLTNKRYNQPIMVKGYSNPRIPKDKDYLELDIQLELSYKTTWAKLRQFGVKTTTFGWKIKFIDPVTNKPIFFNYDFLLTMGALKGRTAEISAFAAAKGGAELNTSLGLLRYTEVDEAGEEVVKEADLKQWNEIDVWRNANTKEVHAEFEYSVTEYEHIKKTDKVDDVVKENYLPDGKTVILTVKVQVLECELPMNIEVSLPREKTTKTSFTYEQLCSMCLQNRRLGEGMIKASESYRQGVQGLIQMISQKYGDNVPVADLTTSDDVKKFAGLEKGLILKTDSQVVSAYGKLFKDGLVLVTAGKSGKKTKWYLNFNTIMSMSTFIGGSASDVAFDIVSLLRWLPTAHKHGSGIFTEIHSRVMLMKRSTEGWLYAQAASSGIQKRLVRSRKGLGTGFTVRTMPLPELSHEQLGDNEWDCIPKIGFSPFDEGLQSLAADPFTGQIPEKYLVQPGEEGFGLEIGNFASWKLHGELAMFSRTPMLMQVAVEIVITENVEVGHAALLGFIWSAANEGDSDGDTIVAALLTAFDITRDEALAMNAHAMGLKGYWIAYGMDASKHPSQEFYSYDDAWAKKALIIESPYCDIYKGLVKKMVMPHVAGTSMKNYLNMTQDVSKHYTQIVGTMYNISVFAVHLALDLQYKVWKGNATVETQNELNLIMDVMPTTWRLLYEGVGLAGYSPDAWKFYKILNASAYTDGWVECFDEDGNMEPGFPTPTTPKEAIKSFSCLKYLGGKEGDGYSHLPNADKMTKKLIELHRTVVDGKALMNPNTEGKQRRIKAMGGRRFMAVMLWSMRLLSKGVDPKAEEVYAPADADPIGDDYGEIPEIQGISMIQEAESKMMWEYLATPWLKDVYQNGLVHMNLANRFVVAYNNQVDED